MLLLLARERLVLQPDAFGLAVVAEDRILDRQGTTVVHQLGPSPEAPEGCRPDLVGGPLIDAGRRAGGSAVGLLARRRRPARCPRASAVSSGIFWTFLCPATGGRHAGSARSRRRSRRRGAGSRCRGGSPCRRGRPARCPCRCPRLPSRVRIGVPGFRRGVIGLVADGATEELVVAEQLFTLDHVRPADERRGPSGTPWSTA